MNENVAEARRLIQRALALLGTAANVFAEPKTHVTKAPTVLQCND